MLEWESMNSKSGPFELITQPLNGLVSSATAYSRLVKACAWHGRADQAQLLLEEAVRKGVNIGSDHYLAFFYAAVHTKKNRGDLEVLLARWKHVSARGLPDSLHDYKAAVHALCILHLSDLAKALVEQLPHMGFHVHMDMYRVLINGCVLAGMPEDAHRILRVMEEEGHQATVLFWDLVLQGFAACGSIQQFKAVLQELAMRNLPRSKQSYVLEMRAHLHNFDATGVLAVKDQVEAAGQKLLDTTCPDLVHAYSMMGDMAAAHQALEMLPINDPDALHVHKRTHTALLEWHARRGEFYEALELYSGPGRRSSWAVYVLAEAAMQHWHQMQGAKETPLAACLIRGGPHTALPRNQQGSHGAIDSRVWDMSLLHVAPSKRWSLGPNNTAILDVQGNNAHLVYYGHWMTQMCFLEALQSLMVQNKSGRPHMIVGARKIQVMPNSKQGRYGLYYKRPELLMTLLTLMQNLGISAYVHNGRVICKPQEIMRVVREAERQGRQFHAATFRGCLVGLEPL
ncbi:probable pentatricopeptide repeat-containing protein At5g39710 [Coccomyxa sp. Obi]|nr:probable pentatricopeptide repeat-containing protein At5g39710 [Coccomyxa sp. Obi]